MAVLPFDDLSDEKGNAFLLTAFRMMSSDGLAKIAGFEGYWPTFRDVLPRVGDAHNNLPDIGRALGVTKPCGRQRAADFAIARVGVRLIECPDRAPALGGEVTTVRSPIHSPFKANLRARLPARCASRTFAPGEGADRDEADAKR